jgi:hypothetical protein
MGIRLIQPFMVLCGERGIRTSTKLTQFVAPIFQDYHLLIGESRESVNSSSSTSLYLSSIF